MTAEIIIAIIAAVSTFLGGMGKLVHWGVTRIAKSHDDAATKACAAQDRATEAIIDNTKVTTRLVVRLEGMDAKLDELRGHKPKKRAQTSPGHPLFVVPSDNE